MQLYSSALVECEDYDSSNNDRNFDVESVRKSRGRKLVASMNHFLRKMNRQQGYLQKKVCLINKAGIQMYLGELKEVGSVLETYIQLNILIF